MEIIKWKKMMSLAFFSLICSLHHELHRVMPKGDKMQWKALRQNENGSTFEQTMDWERVVE